MERIELFDCIIIGGGPAGLNGAVVLGRARRKVLVFDTEEYRNRYSHGMHNYLTRDDVLPSGFLQISRQEAAKYGVTFRKERVVRAEKNKGLLFEVRTDAGNLYHAKKLLVATGMSDNVPGLPGFSECYGHSVFHCPYCDAWEVRDKKLAVYAKDKEGWELALALKGWSEQVVYFTDGGNKIKPNQKAYLDANNICIIKEPLKQLEHKDGMLQGVELKNGDCIPCDALFFVNGFTPQCNLAEAFGCEMGRKGAVATNRKQQTNIPGLYVAGDASRDMHFVVVAAAEGAKAGVWINKELQQEISDAFMDGLRKQKETGGAEGLSKMVDNPGGAG
jgi:thioredoxin reductase